MPEERGIFIAMAVRISVPPSLVLLLLRHSRPNSLRQIFGLLWPSGASLHTVWSVDIAVQTENAASNFRVF
jgi:hypothetical protein